MNEEQIKKELEEAWDECSVEDEEKALLKAVKDIHRLELDDGVGVNFRIELRDFLLDYVAQNK